MMVTSALGGVTGLWFGLPSIPLMMNNTTNATMMMSNKNPMLISLFTKNAVCAFWFYECDRNRLKRDIASSAQTIHDIDTGKARGYSRALFVSSILNKVITVR